MDLAGHEAEAVLMYILKPLTFKSYFLAVNEKKGETFARLSGIMPKQLRRLLLSTAVTVML